jgi:hypothetical protein
VVDNEKAQEIGFDLEKVLEAERPVEEGKYLVSCPNSSMHYYGGSPYREPPWLVDALGSSPSGSVTVNARS